LAERAVRDREVGSSNLPAPTCGIRVTAAHRIFAGFLLHLPFIEGNMICHSASARHAGSKVAGDRERRRLGLRALPLLLASLMLASGCGWETGGAAGRRVRRNPNVLVVYAACGLAPVVEVAQARFEADNRGKSVRVTVGEPSVLAREIAEGAVPDVFICLGDAEIGLLEREGLMDASTAKTVGYYRLVIATPGASPPPIAGYQYLTSPEAKRVVIAAPGTTSAGTYAKAALERMGLWDALQEKLMVRATPREVVETLARGEAEAGLILDPCPLLSTPDAVPAGSVQVAASLTPDPDRFIRAHIGIHKRSPNALLAGRFVRLLTSDELQPELAAAGLPTDSERPAPEEPTQPVESAEPGEPTQPVESAEPGEPTQPVESAESGD
jgi:molybdate transport system substrate-binding protein